MHNKKQGRKSNQRKKTVGENKLVQRTRVFRIIHNRKGITAKAQSKALSGA